MRAKISMAIMAAALLLSSAFQANVFGEEIRIGGDRVGIATLMRPYVDTFQEEAHIPLKVTAGNSIDALISLEKGEIDIIVSADPFDYMVTGASLKNKGTDASGLIKTDLAICYVRVFTNKRVNVSKITQEQLRGIFSGKITNWKALGGKDRKIELVWGEETIGQNALFIAQILNGEPLAKNRITATDYLDIRQKIIDNPGAVGINVEDFMDSRVEFPDAPIFTQQIIAVTKSNPSPKVKKLLDFLVEVGAAISAYNQKGYF